MTSRNNKADQKKRKRKRLGSNDRLVILDKPKSRPKGLSKEEFDSLADHLLLREVH